MPELVRYIDEEWSALYVDGVLNRVGDHYLIDERISEFAGVKNINSNAFMQGGNRMEDIAQTLAEVEAYEELAERIDREADELRAQAARLEAQARELRAKAAH